MQRKYIVIGLVVAFAAGVAGWYAASPWYAMRQLREAAVEGNADDLEERIDFPSVREALKADLSARMAAEMMKQDQRGFGALGSAFAMGFLNTMVDALITPQGMAAMIKQGKLERPNEAPSNAEPVDWIVERDGFDRFRATPDAPEVDNPPSLVFERDGLGWKLVELDIPDEPLTSSTAE